MRKILLAAAAVLGLTAAAFAAEKAPAPPAQDWSFDGIFGTYNKAQLKRGFQIYAEVCASCHSLRHIAYRHLTGIGLTMAEIEKIAAEKEVPGEPDDEGEVKPRPAKPSDMMVRPFANENAARAANNGALPPDLTLIVLARNGGSDYLHALLTGYKDPPKFEPDENGQPKKDKNGKPIPFKLGEGLYYNSHFQGHRIAMAQPLSPDDFEYEDKTKATLSGMARDVTAFLHWAADPYMVERKRMGIKVVLFLLFLTALLYAWKRKVWAELH
jgi:cytochrome c1